MCHPTRFSLSLSYSLFPGSNAFPDRVFSLMNAKWSAARNRMTVGLVKAELQVFVNYNMDYRAFHASVLSDSRLLDAAASNPKYAPVGGARVSGSVANNRP